MTEPQIALEYLRAGGFKMGQDWEKAHAICQKQEGTFAYDLVHALAHWIEGDLANRDYWYRRLDGWQRADSIAAEAEAIGRRLSQG